jgi:hypothetical protein
MKYLPNDMKHPFTNRNLADSLEIPIKLARMITYSLRKMTLLKIVKKAGNTLHFDSNQIDF